MLKPKWEKWNIDSWVCDLGGGVIVEVTRQGSCFTEITFTAWVEEHPEMGSVTFGGRGGFAKAKSAAIKLGKLVSNKLVLTNNK